MTCSATIPTDAPSADPAGADETADAAGSARVRRVALVIDELRPGGGERVVAHLAEGLPRLGVRSLVVCMRGRGLLARPLQRAGIPVRALGSTKGFDVPALLNLARELRKFRPDVVNVHDRSSMPYVLLARCFAGFMPVVFTCHGLLYNASEQPHLRYRLALRASSAVTAVSQEVADRHAAVYGLSRPMHIIPNGVPAHPRSPADRHAVRAELGLADDVFVFLSVGNVRPEKGFEDLIEAAAILGKQAAGRAFACLVAGRRQDEAYCAGLEQLQKRREPDRNVRFLGFRDDTPALYAAADAFVLSSRSEGLPLVVLEAMMAGLPLVATRVGGVPDAVPPDAGLLVEPADPPSLANAMRRLLDDEALCKDLGRRGREQASARFGVEQMVRRYLQCYRQVAARRGAGRAGEPGETR